MILLEMCCTPERTSMLPVYSRWYAPVTRGQTPTSTAVSMTHAGSAKRCSGCATHTHTHTQRAEGSGTRDCGRRRPTARAMLAAIRRLRGDAARSTTSHDHIHAFRSVDWTDSRWRRVVRRKTGCRSFVLVCCATAVPHDDDNRPTKQKTKNPFKKTKDP